MGLLSLPLVADEALPGGGCDECRHPGKGEHNCSPRLRTEVVDTHFLRIPKNMRILDVSSGGFSWT
jgi:hypothetical protein